MKKNVLIYFDLITTLKTTQEVSDFISEIDTFILERTLDSISVDSAKKIRQVFTKNNLDINDKDMVVGFFETLKELLKKLKIIKLVLAFDPTRKTIENIHNFITNNVGVGYILDIETQEDVLAGAIVIFNGNYNDFSLKKTIEETFADRGTEILKLMH
ncbi:MAG: hypothetical protein HW400_388 [Candidatus Levybacteria bacterium]|nr:hypothetical protein [Candidatus Levybacteria bacterium]